VVTPPEHLKPAASSPETVAFGVTAGSESVAKAPAAASIRSGAEIRADKLNQPFPAKIDGNPLQPSDSRYDEWNIAGSKFPNIGTGDFSRPQRDMPAILASSPTTLSYRKVNPSGNPRLYGTDVSTYGVKYDVTSTNGTIAGGSKFSARSNAAFAPADAGKDLIIYYRGNGPIKRFFRGNVWTGCISRVESPTVITFGSWAGSSCVQSGTNLPASADSYTILYGTDDTAALQGAIDRGGNGILDLTGSVMIKGTLLFYDKTGRFEGLGPRGDVTTRPPSGSNIIWAGPAGLPMVMLRNDTAMTLINLHFVGNGNPAHRPGAFLDLVQPLKRGYHGVNSFDSFINISNDPSGQFGQGPFAHRGVNFEDETQNDKHMFYSLRLFDLDTACIAEENQQSVIMDFKDLFCANTPVAWYAPHGGETLFSGVFAASNVGQVFHLGRGARATVENLQAVTSSPAEAGYSQLVYMESNTLGGAGGSLVILHGSFQISSSIPTRKIPLLGHTVTPYAVIDSDNPLGSYIDLQNFSFNYAPTGNTRGWNINLPPINNRNEYYFRCYLCSGLTPLSLSSIRSGTNPASLTFVEIKQVSSPAIFTRQLLKSGAVFRPLPFPSHPF